MEYSKKHKKNYKKEPIYYGVHLEIENEKKLLDILQNSVNLILKEHKEDFNSSYETITELIKRYNEAKIGNEDNNRKNNRIEVNNMKYPNSLHITIYYGGKKGFNKNLKCVKEFQEGNEVEFKPLGCVVVPGKMVIIPALTYFSVDNKYPHITTFLGDLKPFQSNEILENIFSKNMPLCEEYNKILDYDENEYIKKTKVNIDGSEFDAFVHLSGKNCKINGKMKGYYF